MFDIEPGIGEGITKQSTIDATVFGDKVIGNHYAINNNTILKNSIPIVRYFLIFNSSSYFYIIIFFLLLLLTKPIDGVENENYGCNERFKSVCQRASVM